VSCSEGVYSEHHADHKRIKISEVEAKPHLRGGVVVIAIAGSRGCADWRTNFKNTSSPPKGVLV
jgi:hypothetical protein